METLKRFWEFLNTPGKELTAGIVPEDSFLARFWRFITAPGKELTANFTWASISEFIQVFLMVSAMACLILYMMGARGKIAKWLYWTVALYFVLTILS